MRKTDSGVEIVVSLTARGSEPSSGLTVPSARGLSSPPTTGSSPSSGPKTGTVVRLGTSGSADASGVSGKARAARTAAGTSSLGIAAPTGNAKRASSGWEASGKSACKREETSSSSPEEGGPDDGWWWCFFFFAEESSSCWVARFVSLPRIIAASANSSGRSGKLPSFGNVCPSSECDGWIGKAPPAASMSEALRLLHK